VIYHYDAPLPAISYIAAVAVFAAADAIAVMPIHHWRSILRYEVCIGTLLDSRLCPTTKISSGRCRRLQH
jgi:hypothetical protein